MKQVAVTSDGVWLRDIVDASEDGSIVLRGTDGREYLLTAIDEFDYEVARTRHNKEFMAFLKERAREPGAISLEEVKRELGLLDGADAVGDLLPLTEAQRDELDRRLLHYAASPEDGEPWESVKATLQPTENRSFLL